MPSSFFTRDQLYDWYRTKQLSTYSIAEICGCDPKTVYFWLKKFNISTRPKKLVPVTRERLQYLYESGLSMNQIGKSLGCTAAAVFQKMRGFGINSRTPWESNIIHNRYDFSGDQIEKSYLIGFRIGDLNVSRKRNDTFIIVKSSTTLKVQLDLMKSIFSSYGPIWVGKSKGVYNFCTSLNSSFAFLIPKHVYIPRWILNLDNYFFGFLAGYSDAEGSIGIYDGRARFKIGSYDKDLLGQIHEKLLSLKINNSFLLETKKGIVNNSGIKNNGDFWRVSVNGRFALFACLASLLPLLKHSKRREKAKQALRNVLSRI